MPDDARTDRDHRDQPADGTAAATAEPGQLLDQQDADREGQVREHLALVPLGRRGTGRPAQDRPEYGVQQRAEPAERQQRDEPDPDSERRYAQMPGDPGRDSGNQAVARVAV